MKKKKTKLQELNEKLHKESIHQAYNPGLVRLYKKDRREIRKYNRAKTKRDFKF